MNGGAQEGMSVLEQELKSSEKINKNIQNRSKFKFTYCRDIKDYAEKKQSFN